MALLVGSTVQRDGELTTSAAEFFEDDDGQFRLSGAVVWTTVSFLLVEIFAGVFGNCVVCFAVYKNRSLRTPMNGLIVNLCAADIVVSLWASPVLIALLVEDRIITEGTASFTRRLVACRMQYVCHFVVGTVMLITMLLISLERYHAIAQPFDKANRWVRIKISIALTWVAGIVLAGVAFLMPEDDNQSSASVLHTHQLLVQTFLSEFMKLVFVPISVFCVFVIILLYIAIVYLIQKHAATTNKKLNKTTAKKKTQVAPTPDKHSTVIPANSTVLVGLKQLGSDFVVIPNSKKNHETTSRLDPNLSKAIDVCDMNGRNGVSAKNDDAKPQEENHDTTHENKPNESTKEAQTVCNLPSSDQNKNKTKIADSEVNEDAGLVVISVQNSHTEETIEIQPSTTKASNSKTDNVTNTTLLPPENKEADTTLLPPVNHEADTTLLPPVSNEAKTTLLPPVNHEADTTLLPHVKKEAKTTLLPPVDNEADTTVLASVPLVSKVSPSATNTTEAANHAAARLVTEVATKADNSVCLRPKADDSVCLRPKADDSVCLRPKADDSVCLRPKPKTTSVIEICDREGKHVKVTTTRSEVVGNICVMNNNNKERGKRKVEARSARVTAIAMVAFLACWLPLPAVVIATAVSSNKGVSHFNKTLTVASLAISFLSAAINPVVYGLANRQIRNGILRLAKKYRLKFCKPRQKKQ